MKSLFRSIRHKLLYEGKLVRYLTYAVGEVVLIIVGILMALKINDWNEENKARVIETNILTEIRSNLHHDMEEIQYDIVSLEDNLKACDDIIQYLDTHESPSIDFFDMVGLLGVNPHFDPNRSGYDLMVSKGVEIVRNDNLRKSISILYESRYTYYYRYEEERNQFLLHNTFPKIVEYFSLGYKPGTKYLAQHDISPKDYAQLKNDTGFLKSVHAIKYKNSMVLDRAQGTEESIVDLIDQLNEELGESIHM